MSEEKKTEERNPKVHLQQVAWFQTSIGPVRILLNTANGQVLPSFNLNKHDQILWYKEDEMNASPGSDKPSKEPVKKSNLLLS